LLTRGATTPRLNSVSMPKAIWEGVVIAEAPQNECHTVEGNTYFPAAAIKREFFKDSSHHTVCGWKGDCSYYTVEVNGKRNENAAWFYPNPLPAAANIKNHVAFWKGVRVEK